MAKTKQYYYEVVKKTARINMVHGPLKHIYELEDQKGGKPKDYAYAQIIKNKVVHAFKENEILVLNKKLGS